MSVTFGTTIFSLVLLCSAFVPVFSQSSPDTIRGYKVHKEKISVGQNAKGRDALVTIGEPDVIEASLTGLILEIGAEIQALDQSGKVEFLTFHDFKVNGVPVKPEEYTHRFEFLKRETVILPKPARIFLPISGIVNAAWKEMHESKAEWTVTGRVSSSVVFAN